MFELQLNSWYSFARILPEVTAWACLSCNSQTTKVLLSDFKSSRLGMFELQPLELWQSKCVL